MKEININQTVRKANDLEKTSCQNDNKENALKFQIKKKRKLCNGMIVDVFSSVENCSDKTPIVDIKTMEKPKEERPTSDWDGEEQDFISLPIIDSINSSPKQLTLGKRGIVNTIEVNENTRNFNVTVHKQSFVFWWSDVRDKWISSECQKDIDDRKSRFDLPSLLGYCGFPFSFDDKNKLVIDDSNNIVNMGKLSDADTIMFVAMVIDCIRLCIHRGRADVSLAIILFTMDLFEDAAKNCTVKYVVILKKTLSLVHDILEKSLISTAIELFCQQKTLFYFSEAIFAFHSEQGNLQEEISKALACEELDCLFAKIVDQSYTEEIDNNSKRKSCIFHLERKKKIGFHRTIAEFTKWFRQSLRDIKREAHNLSRVKSPKNETKTDSMNDTESSYFSRCNYFLECDFFGVYTSRLLSQTYHLARTSGGALWKNMTFLPTKNITPFT